LSAPMTLVLSYILVFMCLNFLTRFSLDMGLEEGK